MLVFILAMKAKIDIKYIYCIIYKMLLNEITSIPLPKEEEIFYSGYFVSKTGEELSEWIGKQFTSSSDIKSLKRKKAIQSILERFGKYIDSLVEENKYSFHFFVGDETTNFFELDRHQLEIIKKHHKKDEFLMEEFYDWEDFYFNDKFVSAYEVDKNEVMQHYYFTKTKFEERDRVKPDYLRDYLARYPAYFFIENTKSKILEKLGPKIEIQSGRNKHEQLLNTKNELDLQKSIKKLSMQWGLMEKNPDCYVYGNEIIKAIKNYEIKEIYCFEEFKKKLESKLLKELFNFQWNIYPKKLDIPEIGKLETYRGIFGLKYY